MGNYFFFCKFMFKKCTYAVNNDEKPYRRAVDMIDKIAFFVGFESLLSYVKSLFQEFVEEQHR